MIKARVTILACHTSTILQMVGAGRMEILARKAPMTSLPLVSISCSPARLFIVVITATGHSILHELTHLDSLAKQAGLTAPSNGPEKDQHGTEDVQKGSELTGARDWLIKYEKDSTLSSPDINAESYAATATGKRSGDSLNHLQD